METIGEGATDRLIAGAVDMQRGTVSRRIFVDEAIYERELERIFGRSWLFLGHESQLPQPGDYLTCKMGTTPVIVARDAGGTINAFINSCRHRGNQVTRADAGHAAAFTCPYHGWCFDLQGKRVEPGSLVGVPGLHGFYHDRLELADWGLVPLAHVGSYQGLIFGTFDRQAPPLERYLGDFRWFLDAVFGRGKLAVVPGTVRWQMRCNWKFPADNAIGDNSHGQVAHRSAVMAVTRLNGQRMRPMGVQEPGFTLLTEYGHGVNCKTGVAPLPSAESDDEKHKLHIDPAFESWRNDPAIVAGLQPLQAEVLRYNANLFPNLFLIDRLLMLRNPLGAGRTEIRAIAFYDTSAPPEVQRTQRRRAFQKFGPAGLYEQEDGENWDQATAGSRIRELAEYDLHYAMGLGAGEFVQDDRGPSRIETMTNEHAQLWFYRCWAEALLAESWPDLERDHLRPVG